MSTRNKALLLLGLMLSGCVTVDFDKTLAKSNEDLQTLTKGELQLQQSEESRVLAAKAATDILKVPLSQEQAVRLALVNSPELQALLAQNWADAATAAQGGRMANPVFSFERMLSAPELELSRALMLGLLDVLTLPKRIAMAEQAVAYQQLRLSSEVVERVTQVRQAWVRAVSAEQGHTYAKQVTEAAEASAELAKRMLAVGNFSKLQRARQQAFYADAVASLALAQHELVATKEALVRALGLNAAQVGQLRLPARLPDLPKQALSPEQVSQKASVGRLDVRIAETELRLNAKAQNLNFWHSFTDVEVGAKRTANIERDGAHEHKTRVRGYEVSVRLPLFDWGDLMRQGANARTMASAHRLESSMRQSSSNLREAYSSYRTAHDLALHHRLEIVPLRKLISEENVLRYNGMLIGVFELLADAREQIRSVQAALKAEEEFWLAEAALEATLFGKPSMSKLSVNSQGEANVGH